MTLVGPTARCQQRQNLAFTQRTARSLHPSREKERNIFSWMLKGQVTSNRVETAEGVGVAASRGETGQVELPRSADACWVLSDLSMTTSDAPWSLLWCCLRLVIGVSVVVALWSNVQDVGDLCSWVLENPCVSHHGRQAMLDRRLFGTDGSGGDDLDKEEETCVPAV